MFVFAGIQKLPKNNSPVKYASVSMKCAKAAAKCIYKIQTNTAKCANILTKTPASYFYLLLQIRMSICVSTSHCHAPFEHGTRLLFSVNIILLLLWAK